MYTEAHVARVKSRMLFHIAMILTLIGSLNWGVIGVSSMFGNRFDVVEWLAFDVLEKPIVGDIIYTVIGVAAVVTLILLRKRLS